MPLDSGRVFAARCPSSARPARRRARETRRAADRRAKARPIRGRGRRSNAHCGPSHIGAVVASDYARVAWVPGLRLRRPGQRKTLALADSLDNFTKAIDVIAVEPLEVFVAV